MDLYHSPFSQLLLLGADFLWAHSLLLDIKGQRLINPSDFTSITLRSVPAAVPHLDSIESAHDEFARLLAKSPRGTLPPHQGTTSPCMCMATSSRQTEISQGGIERAGNYPSFKQPVHGLHLSTWCQSHQVGGGPAEIFDVSMMSQHPTASYPVSRNYTGLQCQLSRCKDFFKNRSCTIIRSLSTLRMFLRQCDHPIWPVCVPFSLKNAAQSFMDTVLQDLDFTFS